MPQDSVQQAIIRGALVRLNQASTTPGDLSDDDSYVVLSRTELGTMKDVLNEFLREPAEPGGA